MTSRNLALLIPASYVGMTNPAFGSVFVHSSYANKHGKVLWSVFPPGKRRTELGEFRHKGIKVAYFYDVLSRLVRFKAKIHTILGGSERRHLHKYDTYIPRFRREYSSRPGQRKEYWILLSNIAELAKPVRLTRLSRSQDGRPLRQVRLYAIIMDPHLQAIRG